MKGDEGFAGSGGESEQDAVAAGGDGFEDTLDGDVLVVATLEVAAFVFEGDGCEAVAPGVGFGEGQVPEFVRGGIAGEFAFGAGLPIYAVKGFSVGGVSEADGEFFGIALGLGNAFGGLLVPGFGFDDGEFGVAIDENVVGDEGSGTASSTFEAAEGDGVFAEDATALDAPPSGSAESGLDVLGSGFGFAYTRPGSLTSHGEEGVTASSAAAAFLG